MNRNEERANTKRINDDVLAQGRSTRKYVSVSLPLVSEIDLAETDPPLFKPTYLQVDEEGFVYSLSWRNFRIYKFSLGEGYNKKDLVVFGKGRGQGPGELSQPMDLKVLNGNIYISDQNTGSIEVYSTSGEYLKRITFHDKEEPVFPIRIVPMKNGIFIHTLRRKSGKLFSFCDDEGRVIYSFGNHYNQDLTSVVLLDGQTSNGFLSRFYYYFPLYLGIAYLYDEQRLIFTKETIDGVRRMRESEDAIEKAKKFMTARSFALGGEIIVVIARDRKMKKNYWDVYRMHDFTYLFSLAEPPIAKEIAISKRSLICLDDEKMTVYGLDDLLLKVQKYIQVITSSN